MSDAAYQPMTFPTIDAADRFRTATRAEVRGHAAGYAAGLRQAGAEVQAMAERLAADHAARVTEHDALVTARLTALDAAVAALTARVAPVLDEAGETLVAAAFELAEVVVGYEIDPVAAPVAAAVAAPVEAAVAAPVASGAVASGPDVVTSASAGLEARLVPGARAAVARALASVDPAVVVTLRLAPEDVAALADVDLPVPVTVDASLRHGDAVAELPDGVVDARIRTALDRARDALGVRS